MGEHDATRRVPSCCGCCGSREAGTSGRAARTWTASGQSGAEEKHVHVHAGWLCAACASDSIQAKARRVAETRARCAAARERIESCLARLGQPTTRGERRPLAHEKREQRRAEMRATEEALEEALREARNRIAERRRRSGERRRQIELASEKLTAQRAEMLWSHPDQLRCLDLQLRLIQEQHKKEQRAAVRQLRAIIQVHIVKAPATAAGTGALGAVDSARRSRNVGVRVGGTMLPNLEEASDWAPSSAQDAGYALGQILQFVRVLSAYTRIPMLCEPYFQSSTSYVSEARCTGHGDRCDADEAAPWLALHIPQAIIQHREYAMPSAAIDSMMQGVFSSSIGSSFTSSGLFVRAHSCDGHNATEGGRGAGCDEHMHSSSSTSGIGSILKTTPKGQSALREFKRAVFLLKRASSALCGAQFTRMGLANPVGLDPLAQLAIISSLLSRSPSSVGESAKSGKARGDILSSSCFGLNSSWSPSSPQAAGAHTRVAGTPGQPPVVEIASPSVAGGAGGACSPQAQECTMSSSGIAALVQRFVSGDFYDSDDGAVDDCGIDDDDETDGWEAIEKPLAPRPSDLPEDIVNWEREVLASDASEHGQPRRRR